MIFKWGLLRAKQRTEREWPHANGKRPLLGILPLGQRHHTELPPGALTHGGGGQPRAMRGQGAPQQSPTHQPGFTQALRSPLFGFPGTAPARHHRVTLGSN